MAAKRNRNTAPVRGKHAKHAAPPAGASKPSQKAKKANGAARPSQVQRPVQAQPTHSGQTAARPTSPDQARAAQAQTAQSRPAQAPESRSFHMTPAQAQRAAKPKKKRRVPLAAKIILAVVFVGIIVAGSLLTWNYLFRYDDAADIQGQWKIEGSNASIVITDSEIRLTDSVSFGYDLNTFEKTLTYRYANFEGVSGYVFSPERDVLTLTDMNTDPNESDAGGDADQSMRLLKVSDQAVGEPETADNNDTSDAQTNGADVIDGSMSPEQAERDEQRQSASSGGN